MFARAMRIQALAAFLIGSLVFAANYFFGGVFLLIGYGYILVAGMVNLILFAITLSTGIRNRHSGLLISAGIMLLNIPAMLVYVWLTFRSAEVM